MSNKIQMYCVHTCFYYTCWGGIMLCSAEPFITFLKHLIFWLKMTYLWSQWSSSFISFAGSSPKVSYKTKCKYKWRNCMINEWLLFNPSKQFLSYIMARTCYILTRRWYPLCTKTNILCASSLKQPAKADMLLH